jgi:endonuclease/exonuclease/phosphatase family metal-dependent hydrolase
MKDTAAAVALFVTILVLAGAAGATILVLPGAVGAAQVGGIGEIGGIGVTGGLVARQPARVEQETSPVTLRLLTYNIKHGLGNDGKLDLERAAAVINSLQPDMVALQEVDNRAERTGGADQAQRLGELTGMHAVFGDFMEYQGGHYGMAILSRYPIVESENHRLPDGDEPRTALAARVRVDDTGREIVFVGIHLYRTAEERLCQAKRVVDAMAGESVPVILAGDFNSTPESEVMSLIRGGWVIPDKGENHLTFSSDDPRSEIDFIAYRPGEIFEVLEHRVIDEPVVSDHRPVLLTLRMR